MKVWVTCFIVLFGVAELLQWLREFSLPLPVFIVGGAFLAIASNYDKLRNLPFHPEHENLESAEPAKETANASPAKQTTSPQSIQNQPPISPTTRMARSISYTIHKPFQPGD
jgi:hypothetical protein